MVIGIAGFTCEDPAFAIGSPQIWPHLAALLVRALLGFATFAIQTNLSWSCLGAMRDGNFL